MQIISNYDIIKRIKNINESQKRIIQLVKLKSLLKQIKSLIDRCWL